MNRKAVLAIAKKDITSITSSVQLFLPIIVVPLIILILVPGGLLIAARYVDVTETTNMGPILKLLDSLPAGNLKTALDSFTDINQKMLFLFLNYFFAPLFLLIPLMAASIVSANSFAGEKERRTLESLLFAPVDIFSLFLGKVLAAFALSMVMAVVGFILYGLVVNGLGYAIFHRLIFPEPNWWVLIFFVAPSFSFLAILFNVIVSAKVKGFQEANQMSVFVILPVLALVISQITGALLISSKVLWVIGIVTLLLSVFVLRQIVKHFDRNKLFESQIF
ncbi:MAG: ABC transporter permease subunit [Bacillota bacterium]|jgi:ABC-2 type transport system permease protein|nr:ABC transporter permease subunit [Bacillota bacterium]HOA91261.1 ABC transporter permease subunit [Bacillota bacterium]HOJ46038.1 ABC transporter permease subunit [Bacillota bacterium]HPQ11382.1 ABC transporter permease subunit [Bacillota bacterium]HPZ73251.1 ABC transporter permease subunit [Bacillota bacterium]